MNGLRELNALAAISTREVCSSFRSEEEPLGRGGMNRQEGDTDAQTKWWTINVRASANQTIQNLLRDHCRTFAIDVWSEEYGKLILAMTANDI